MCPTCNVIGPNHKAAVRDALAAGRIRVAYEAGQSAGRGQAYDAALRAARLELIEARVQQELAARPFVPDHELEAG